MREAFVTRGEFWRAVGAAALIILIAGVVFTALIGGAALLNAR